ncbi:hypothetical protein F383_37792 [Gossypium arboreum]|uniref:Uncharacterized protein n=1 Tax=Gossypium arboreum TaxID=29729 RepID=A0A0B0MDV5_GOSAR|nr:hypothetical protein F383_37792 [Gossypium arboreum]
MRQYMCRLLRLLRIRSEEADETLYTIPGVWVGSVYLSRNTTESIPSVRFVSVRRIG